MKTRSTGLVPRNPNKRETPVIVPGSRNDPSSFGAGRDGTPFASIALSVGSEGPGRRQNEPLSQQPHDIRAPRISRRWWRDGGRHPGFQLGRKPPGAARRLAPDPEDLPAHHAGLP